MLQITADIATLTPEQREAVSAFILSFPSEAHTHIPAFAVAPDEDEAEPTPEVAFDLKGLAASSSQCSVDAAGLPWDERIHSSNRAFVSDGTWRKRRGVDDALVAKVEGELKAVIAPVTLASNDAPATFAAAIPAPLPIALVPAPPAPAPEPVAVIPPPPCEPVLSVTANRDGFIALVTKASAAIAAKTLTRDEVDAACKAVGVAGLPDLGKSLELVPTVMSLVESYIAGRAA